MKRLRGWIWASALLSVIASMAQLAAAGGPALRFAEQASGPVLAWLRVVTEKR